MSNPNGTYNKLINEKSPYLLQHAHNPVNWYPWGNEAFEAAKREDKPIFLSIGYSTCHWCHVMEQESFEDEEVAEMLNRNFIAIKVDKEERPDIDAIYMTTCQALTGHGGWPLTILMSYDQKPFFAGTYFPKKSKYHMPGLMELLNSVIKQWKQDRDLLLEAGRQVANAVKTSYEGKAESGDLSMDAVHTLYSLFRQSFDEKNGGFGNAPKFPSPHNLMFLLRYYIENKKDEALQMVEKTLQQMYRGGIFDHIGFGFSRYSTDERWLIPHFEKMLYDNALLIMAYLETYQITKNTFYKDIAEKVMQYILREMTDSEGGFYSAQDADSDGEEGKYYAFTPEEIIDILGEEAGTYLNSFFHITKEGNFEGKSIPNLLENAHYDQMDEGINQMLDKISDYRSKRTVLHKDDKILTSWNALMIIAFVKAYRILGDESYLYTAKRALDFLQRKLADDKGQLSIRYREGDAAGVGILDDYAFLVWLFIEFYEVTFEISYLKEALFWNEKMMQNFWDNENGGFYMTSENSEALLCRPKELYDGAIPSGNSVAAYSLIRLARITAESDLEETAYQQLQYMAWMIQDYPFGYSFYAMALQYALSTSKEVICVVKEQKEADRIRERLQDKFIPHTMIVMKNMEQEEEVNRLIPYLKHYQIIDNQATFYVCENKTCKAPFHSLEQLFNSI